MKIIKKYQKTLANGLKIISLPSAESDTVTALVMVKTGSKYENSSENGLSHFLEHLFFKGSKKRPTALALAGELDSLGSEFNAFTGKEYTGYWIKVAAGRLGPALEILTDMLFSPLFPAEEIEREKGVVIEEIKMYKDNPLMHIEDVFESCLYGNTPAGREIIGNRKNVRSFSRSSVLNYYRRQYGGKSLTLILSGAVNSKELRTAERLFSIAPQNPWRDKAVVKDKQEKAAIKILSKKIDQANLSLGVRAFPVDHPQEMAVKILSLILGGSMSSRLFSNLRERNGLAYYVKTIFEQYSDSGYLSSQAGVPLGKLPQALKIVINEYRSIANQGVEPAELRRAKKMISGRLPLRLEASDDLANWYGRQAISRKKLISPEEYLQKIKAIKISEVNQAAKDIFSQPLSLAIIGNISENKKNGLFNLLKI